MSSIGEKLRCARLEQGLELSAVSTRTKIPRNYLEAIESDDRKKLPSGFFYRSFVDQYSRVLSLDTREIDSELDRILAADAPLPLPGQDGNPIHRVPPMRVRTRFRWVRALASVASLLLVMLGCAAIYAWWHDGRLPIDLPLLRGSLEIPRVVEAAKRLDIVKPSEVSLAVHREPESEATVSDSPAEPEAPATSAPAERPQTPAPAKTLRAAGSRVLLDLMAREKTWLSVSSDGKPVFSGVLAAHQTKIIEGKQFAKLTVGNAAGLEVRLNGKRLGRLGARGQVLVVVFTPDNFEIISPAKEGD